MTKRLLKYGTVSLWRKHTRKHEKTWSEHEWTILINQSEHIWSILSLKFIHLSEEFLSIWINLQWRRCDVTGMMVRVTHPWVASGKELVKITIQLQSINLDRNITHIHTDPYHLLSMKPRITNLTILNPMKSDETPINRNISMVPGRSVRVETTSGVLRVALRRRGVDATAVAFHPAGPRRGVAGRVDRRLTSDQLRSTERERKCLGVVGRAASGSKWAWNRFKTNYRNYWHYSIVTTEIWVC